MTQIFHTIPLKAPTMERLPDGSKTNPGFPPTWEQYITERNTNNTHLLAAIAREDFIGIDFDTYETFEHARTLAPNADYVAQSIPASKGGHILFRYTQQAANILKELAPHLDKIDIQINNKLIYLATPANKTKRLLTPPLTSLPSLPVPDELINYLALLAFKNLKEKAVEIKTSYEPLAYSTLGYLLESPPYDLEKILPRKLTPKHPKLVPEGQGTEWMLRVRFKLAQDPSVSAEKFREFIEWLNLQWDKPMTPERVKRDIEYDIHTRKNPLTGELLWRYDPNWAEEGFIFSNSSNEIVEIMYDPLACIYILHNRTTDTVARYSASTDAANAVLSLSNPRMVVSGKAILSKCAVVNYVSSPEHTFGKSGEIFNDYKPAEGTQILRGEVHIADYKKPEKILKFLKNLIPDYTTRNLFLRFIAHKHTTYEHSPLFFVLAGVSGAGKGVLTQVILPYFSGLNRITDGDLDMLINRFNGWKLTTDYLLIDEAGEGNTRVEQKKLIKALKELTGRSTTNITYKGKETGTPQRHYITPVLTTNIHAQLITDTPGEDRRLVIIKCPNKMSSITDGDTPGYIEGMKEELPYFAKYLKMLSDIEPLDYISNENWKGEDYYHYMNTSLSPLTKLKMSAEKRDVNGFINTLLEFGVTTDKIDSLFSVSTKKRARALLYKTGTNAHFPMNSLEDIATDYPVFTPANIRKEFRELKSRPSYTLPGEERQTKIEVLTFDDEYKPFSENPNTVDLSVD